ncbi:MAG: polynucleotide adenylyltransferase PcnB [Blastocatellia bacterium]|nr:MAG: polynucleotide adenylyltransferase PcnB [Blastocatellia bacterium]
MPTMAEPRVVPRAEHPISRQNIDPDALKVLYRLRQFNYTAYLVGGSVRDLLIGRRPKDFDIGTSAHPYQVKKLFRNCWIIGRRFRLAHVRFGPKVIEVATFRRQVTLGEEMGPGHDERDLDHAANPAEPTTEPNTAGVLREESSTDHFIHRDNTFGTPEEDAFRRDFTINALFYDIATFSIIDYVGGLDDLRAGVVRSIGDPEVRFREDPVRMMRAVALAARLDFTIDQPILDAIRVHRHEIARSSPPRVLEEYYKILRAGSAERTFRDLARLGLLEPVTTELHHGAAEPLWRSLAALDAHRRRFDSTPEILTNALLLGTLLVPLGLHSSAGRREDLRCSHDRTTPLVEEEADPRDLQGRFEHRAAGPRLGELPLARRDIERLRQMLALQRRLHDLGVSPRAKRALVHRSPFREALAWLEIHGGRPDLVEHWKAFVSDAGPMSDATGGDGRDAARTLWRRKRRRRRRFRPTPQ